MILSAIFSSNLQTLRRNKHLTQQALADKAGISIAYVSMLERGQRSPPLETIEVLAKVLKVPAVSMLEKPKRGR
jgi:transcriptional regulator with XRE-family HTH domain